MLSGRLTPRAAALTGIASLGLLGLTVLPAAAAPHHPAAAAQGRPQWLRSNTGATHSPRVLHQLAGPVNASGTVQNGTNAITNMPAVLPGAARGVDVASFQHPQGDAIDWQQVAGAGIKFAAVKVTEGAYYINPYASSDLTNAQSAGLSTVAYAFAIPNGGSNGTTQYSGSPVTQADDLLSALGSNAATTALMLDIEYDPYAGTDGTPAGSWCYGLSQSAMVSWISGFDGEVQAKTGRLPIIYTPAAWWHTCTGDSTASGQTTLWVPDYSSSGGPGTLPAGWSTWNFWQYSSSGTVPGINATTDLDQLNPAMITLLAPGLQQSAPNQSTVAGSPVRRQFQTSDSASGQVPTFTATGLPPGPALSTSGTITGWPDKPGTYQATVTAADSAAGSGSASFTWTVSAAPTAGPAGPIKLKLNGKCLDDYGNRTTNGNKIDIQTCNGSAAQHWTVVKDQTIRIHGKCLDVYHGGTASGTKVQLYSCSGSTAENWRVATDGELIDPHSNLCLTDPGNSSTNGTQVQIVTCGGHNNQKWALPAGPVVSGIPGKCLDDSGNRTTNGNKIDISGCSSTAGSQQWTVGTDQTIRIHGKCLDVYRSGAASGTKVQLYSCNSTAAQKWNIQGSGSGSNLVNPNSNLCLTVPGDSTTNGTGLVVSTCAGALGQAWRIQ